MTHRARGILAAAAACAAGSWIGAAAVAEECGVCHPEVRVAYAESVHAGEAVACTSCHGGDGSSRDVDRAHGGSFRGLTDRRIGPALCAECHASLERMRPYNLPIDQYAIYQTSQHGRALAAGETRAAICSDCHGVHDVRRVSDPASAAASTRIVETCGGCHGDAGLMEEFGLDPGVAADYVSGVHGRALLEARNTAAPDCTSCHGAHGPAPPGVGDIDKICGSCHTDERRAFRAGAHYEGMLAAALPECASCHSNHAVHSLDTADLGELCGDCHGGDSAERAVGVEIHSLIESATAEVDAAEELTGSAERSAVRIEDYLSRLEEARTLLTEARSAVHAVSAGEVELFARRARSIGEEVQIEIHEKIDRSEAYIGLAVFWFYLATTLAILFAYRRRLGRPKPQR